MKNQLNYLSEERFKTIKTDLRLCKAIAHAHGHRTKDNVKKEGKIALYYPERFLVNEDQIKEAKAHLEVIKQQTLKEHKNSLLFVAMGGDYESKYEGDLCNHRIRTQFKNPEGNVFLIEVTKNVEGGLYVSHSVDVTHKEKHMRLAPRNHSQPYYNYGKIRGTQHKGKYDEKTVLNLVNRVFKCHFKEIFISRYGVSCDGVICESPKS